MTKEEYKSLLNSDYWRGYSYAIVKERDWTCEDCGKKFKYQRNMLNVHHLTYHNDNKPWQYDKEELLLLCKDCHAKRHGKLNTNIDYKNDGILENKNDSILENNEDNTSEYNLAFIFIAIFIFIVIFIMSMGIV